MFMEADGEDCTDDVNQIIRDTGELMKSQFKKKNLILNLDLQEHLPKTCIAPDLLKQLVLNLVINAIEACSRGDHIVIKTIHDTVKGEIHLVVKDTGKGISEENLRHIFNPFFSYGKGKKGSGLGLSVCYGIVNRSDGKIQIRSQENKGTSIEVILHVDEYSHS